MGCEGREVVEFCGSLPAPHGSSLAPRFGVDTLRRATARTTGKTNCTRRPVNNPRPPPTANGRLTIEGERPVDRLPHTRFGEIYVEIHRRDGEGAAEKDVRAEVSDALHELGESS